LRWARQFVFGCGLFAVSLFSLAQQAATPSTSVSHLELPVELQQKIVAGSTAVGTPVRAKLTLATLVNGAVIPDGAIITGKVEESVAKNADSPSRLKIHFESAHWKNGGAPLSLFLAGSYYPIEITTTRNDESGMHGEVGVTMGGMQPGMPRAPTGVPTADASRNDDTMPDPQGTITTSEVSKHWVRIKGVDTATGADGSLEITSKERNIKLDKGVTYSIQNALPSAK
jgi:hypothetical protein